MVLPPELRLKVYEEVFKDRYVQVKFIPDDTDPTNIDPTVGSYRSLVIKNDRMWIWHWRTLISISYWITSTSSKWLSQKEKMESAGGENVTARKASMSLSILSINKQIAAEALPIFLTQSTFAFNDTNTFTKWMNDRPAYQKAMIQHLRLYMDMDRDGYEGGPETWNRLMNLETIKGLTSVHDLHLTLNFYQRPRLFVIYSEEAKEGRLRGAAAYG